VVRSGCIGSHCRRLPPDAHDRRCASTGNSRASAQSVGSRLMAVALQHILGAGTRRRRKPIELHELMVPAVVTWRAVTPALAPLHREVVGTPRGTAVDQRCARRKAVVRNALVPCL
jgi:hypothetical protein